MGGAAPKRTALFEPLSVKVQAIKNPTQYGTIE